VDRGVLGAVEKEGISFVNPKVAALAGGFCGCRRESDFGASFRAFPAGRRRVLLGRLLGQLGLAK